MKKYKVINFFYILGTIIHFRFTLFYSHPPNLVTVTSHILVFAISSNCHGTMSLLMLLVEVSISISIYNF